MENGRSIPRSIAILALLLGVSGCEERSRPIYLGPGDHQGPTASVTAPGELDTVHTGTTFFLVVRATDPDGVDSVWTTLEPNVNTLQSFSGGGDALATAGFTVLVPGAVAEETLYVHVRAVDMLGDTGDVYTRRLIID